MSRALLSVAALAVAVFVHAEPFEQRVQSALEKKGAIKAEVSAQKELSVQKTAELKTAQESAVERKSSEQPKAGALAAEPVRYNPLCEIVYQRCLRECDRHRDRWERRRCERRCDWRYDECNR